MIAVPPTSSSPILIISNVKTTKVGLDSFEIIEGTPYHRIAPIVTEQESDLGYYTKGIASPTNYLVPNMKDLESGISVLAEFLKLILEGISVLCILAGLLQVLRQIFTSSRRSLRLASSIAFTDFRIRFGAWLLLALEFQLAGDIVNTTVAPSFEALGKLGAIAVVRTFLNFFLNRELIETLGSKKQQLSAAPDVGDRECE